MLTRSNSLKLIFQMAFLIIHSRNSISLFKTVQTNAQVKGDVSMEHVNVSKVGLGRVVTKVLVIFSLNPNNRC